MTSFRARQYACLALLLTVATGCPRDDEGDQEPDASVVADAGADAADTTDTTDVPSDVVSTEDAASDGSSVEDVMEDAADTTAQPDTADAADTSDTADTAPDAGEPDPCANPSSPAPIVGVDLSTTIFVGRPALPASQRPSGPTPVSDFDDYRAAFASASDTTGRVDSGGMGENLLAWSVYLYFQNGGSEAIIVPTADDVPTDADLAKLAGLDAGGLLVVPGVSSADTEQARTDGANRVEVALEADGNEDLFFVGDLPEGLPLSALDDTTPPAPLGLQHDRAALYYPWLTVTSAAASNQTTNVPPAGAVAGIVARTDRDKGVWKSPAGLDADIRAVQGLAQTFDDTDTSTLTQHNINALRVMQGQPVVWGARAHQSTSLEFRYVPVRRLVMHVEESILEGTRWARFYPNDATTWADLHTHTDNFLEDLFRRGAFQGATHDDAYFVKVDQTTTTAADIAAGRANIVFGIAPIRPAEFVVRTIPVSTGTCVATD